MGNFGNTCCPPCYTPIIANSLPLRRGMASAAVSRNTWSYPLLCCATRCARSCLCPTPSSAAVVAIAILSTSRLLPSCPSKRACSMLLSSYGLLSARPRLGIPLSLGRTRGSLQQRTADAEETAHSASALPTVRSSSAAHNLARAHPILHGRCTQTNVRPPSRQPKQHSVVGLRRPNSTLPSARDGFLTCHLVRYPLPSTNAIRSHRRGTRLLWRWRASHPKQRKVHQVNVGPALPCLTINPGDALPLVQSLTLCSDLVSNSLVLRVTAPSPISQLVKIFCLSYRSFKALFGSCNCLPLLHDMHSGSKALCPVVKNARYGCIPLQRPHSDSTGNVDNKARR
ncbi:hypothetical protein NX059_006744 [Plenodomus lindquistii]|nr:hypothetical protein NX059_006744 [Plenodomus lindquistii]